MRRWVVEKVAHFEPGDLIKDGAVHFGFHDAKGRQYVIQHQEHFLGLVGGDGKLEWTAAAEHVLPSVPNIKVNLRNPIYIDTMLDGRMVVSNFGDGRLHVIDVASMRAEPFVDGPALGIEHAGNCVVDLEGCVWLNEVEGCKVWRFDPSGIPILTLGDGKPGFQQSVVGFDEVRFNWIYDIRRGPDGNVYVLDSKNFALRMIDLGRRCVRTLAGTGRPGYGGDGGPAAEATFGSELSARYDGPISLSLDGFGNMFVGDRFNHVVRYIDRSTGIIETIAGRHAADDEKRNDLDERDPLKLNLPKISSMDYHDGHVFIPTDLSNGSGDLAIIVAR